MSEKPILFTSERLHPLFNHVSYNLGLWLTEDEMREIIQVVDNLGKGDIPKLGFGMCPDEPLPTGTHLQEELMDGAIYIEAAKKSPLETELSAEQAENARLTREKEYAVGVSAAEIKSLHKEVDGLKAENAKLHAAIAESSHNCPSCGSHAFGVLSHPIEENRKLKAELAEWRKMAELMRSELYRLRDVVCQEDVVSIESVTRQFTQLQEKYSERACGKCGERIKPGQPSYPTNQHQHVCGLCADEIKNGK